MKAPRCQGGAGALLGAFLGALLGVLLDAIAGALLGALLGALTGALLGALASRTAAARRGGAAWAQRLAAPSTSAAARKAQGWRRRRYRAVRVDRLGTTFLPPGAPLLGPLLTRRYPWRSLDTTAGSARSSAPCLVFPPVSARLHWPCGAHRCLSVRRRQRWLIAPARMTRPCIPCPRQPLPARPAPCGWMPCGCAGSARATLPTSPPLPECACCAPRPPSWWPRLARWPLASTAPSAFSSSCSACKPMSKPGCAGPAPARCTPLARPTSPGWPPRTHRPASQGR